MKIGNRILHLRKDVLRLNQTDFGKPVGIKKAGLSKIESGYNNPSEAIMLSICREYKVDENWLRTGEGDMFVDESNDLDFLMAQYGHELTDVQRALIESVLKLDSQQREAFDRFLKNFVSGVKP